MGQRYGWVGLWCAGLLGLGVLAGADTAAAQDNSCQYAYDSECDHPGIGTGACPAGTDTYDCSGFGGGVAPDSCQYAFDGECDHPGVGTGACTAGTDTTDCSLGPDSCEYAFDGECDHPGIGTGACPLGTDSSDCRRSRGGQNSCQYAYDGECDEPGIGTGYCTAGTDTADCRGVSATSDLVISIQRLLRNLGYDPGGVDGQVGPRTRAAIRRFQRDYGYPETGQTTQELLTQLQAAAR